MGIDLDVAEDEDERISSDFIFQNEIYEGDIFFKIWYF